MEKIAGKDNTLKHQQQIQELQNETYKQKIIILIFFFFFFYIYYYHLLILALM